MLLLRLPGSSVRDRLGAQAHVSAPATSANLGPGFDSFGLCLGLRDTVSATVTGSSLRVEIMGESADSLPRDESHLVVTAMRAAFTLMEVPQPGLELVCHNVIPHSRGLGSSAAAVVSGIRLAEQLVGRDIGADRRLELATRLEGHPDNVAACLLGGFTIAWTEARRPRALRLDVHADVQATVFVPGVTLSTAIARGLLPTEIGHADAASNSARAGLLAAALTLRPDLLLAATRDLLHQDYRRSAMPATLALLDAMREAGVAAVVSGAGPTLLAFGTTQQPVDAARWARPGWRSSRQDIDADGATSGEPPPAAE
ncbi:MAG: homoserine kinase [Nocardioidaceae bacterium]|nr:homoserine kinase [Nocardioidaceae bacterium]